MSDLFGETVVEAKARILGGIETRKEYIHCPCCGQMVKLWKRKLNSSMAQFLIWLYREWTSRAPGVEWCHPYRHRNGLQGTISGDNAKVRYWGLAEDAPKDPKNTKTRTSGLWRPTQRGLEFCRDPTVTVPKYAYIYDKRLYRFSDESTTIIDSLGNPFNYRELMGYQR